MTAIHRITLMLMGFAGTNARPSASAFKH
jgi:hypothetical protein